MRTSFLATTLRRSCQAPGRSSAPHSLRGAVTRAGLARRAAGPGRIARVASRRPGTDRPRSRRVSWMAPPPDANVDGAAGRLAAARAEDRDRRGDLDSVVRDAGFCGGAAHRPARGPDAARRDAG